MKAGQFTNEQIVAILQEAEKSEKPISTLCWSAPLDMIQQVPWFRSLKTMGGTK